jgi:hypothetical protein
MDPLDTTLSKVVGANPLEEHLMEKQRPSSLAGDF